MYTVACKRRHRSLPNRSAVCYYKLGRSTSPRCSAHTQVTWVRSALRLANCAPGSGVRRARSSGNSQLVATMASARRNHSCRSKWHDLDSPIAEGSFRYVAKGVYTEGPRNGQPCVAKWFKRGDVYEDVFFQEDIKAVEQAQNFVDAFNSERIISQTIFLNHPEVWEFTSGSREGRLHLVEPYIGDFQKFNSNTGMVFGDCRWNWVMQALSHFSYHKSGGQMVLCDLQGGILNTNRYKGAVLTDPVILSRTRSYGVTDLGPDGISTFFARHTCNEYCRGHWTRQRHTAVCFAASAGTSMQLPGRGGHNQQQQYGRRSLDTFQENSEEGYDSDSDGYY